MVQACTTPQTIFLVIGIWAVCAVVGILFWMAILKYGR